MRFWCFVCLFLVVSTSAVNCLKIIYYVSSGTLNHTHSLISITRHTVCLSVCLRDYFVKFCQLRSETWNWRRKSGVIKSLFTTQEPDASNITLAQNYRNHKNIKRNIKTQGNIVHMPHTKIQNENCLMVVIFRTSV